MADKRPPRPKLTSPRGTFVFPKLTEPDTKFKAEGEYSVKLRLAAGDDATQAFLAKLEPLHAAAVVKGEAEFAKLPVASRKKLGKATVNPFYSEVFDKETEEPTGEIEVKFTMKASGVVKDGPRKGKPWTQAPDIFDAKGHAMTKPPAIWGGTVGKVSFEVGDYFIPGTGVCGLTLGLRGVQVIDLVSAGGARSAKEHGFGEEDGGYEYEEAAGGGGDTGTHAEGASDDNEDF